jgi:hypothetical protein
MIEKKIFTERRIIGKGGIEKMEYSEGEAIQNCP